MTVINVEVRSPLSPEEVLRVITDFGPRRAEAWPSVDDEHLTVHDQGDGWADVTEGNKIGWERERYSWDADAGTIAAVTTESNLWAPGSRWDYRITPTPHGTLVGVRLERHGKGVKGKLIERIIPLIGKKMITDALSAALKIN